MHTQTNLPLSVNKDIRVPLQGDPPKGQGPHPRGRGSKKKNIHLNTYLYSEYYKYVPTDHTHTRLIQQAPWAYSCVLKCLVCFAGHGNKFVLTRKCKEHYNNNGALATNQEHTFAHTNTHKYSSNNACIWGFLLALYNNSCDFRVAGVRPGYLSLGT